MDSGFRSRFWHRASAQGHGKSQFYLLPDGAPSPRTGFSPLRTGRRELWKQLAPKLARNLGLSLSTFKMQTKGRNTSHAHSLREETLLRRTWAPRPEAGGKRPAPTGGWVPAPRGASDAHRALSPRAVLDRCPCAAFLPGSGSGQRPQAPTNVTQRSVPSVPAEKAARGSRTSRPPAQSLQGVQQTAISPHPQGKLTVTLMGPKLGQSRVLPTRHRLPDTTSLET